MNRLSHRLLARIPPTIALSVALLAVSGGWLCTVRDVRAGNVGGAIGSAGKTPARPGKLPDPPAFGVAEDDESILLVDRPGRLANVTPNHKVIALDLSQADLKRDGAEERVTQWVQQGGVVWTHTDAAASFGFRVQSLRNAAELYGRALAAPPWNAHFLTRGVQRVYYSMKASSVYAVAHPRALMLLRNTDNPGQTASAPLYVAAYLPLGRGAVIFAPPYVHRRAHGAAFQQALRGFSTAKTALVEIPVKEVEAVANLAPQFAGARDESATSAFGTAQAHVAVWSALAQARGKNRDRALATVERALALPGANADVFRMAATVYVELGEPVLSQGALRKAGPEPRPEGGGVGLLLSAEELDHAEQVFGLQKPAGGAGKAAPAARAGGAAAASLARVWLGRLYYQLGSNSENLARADQYFTAALKLDETSNEANRWEGYLLASAGRNSRLASEQRAQYLMNAAQYLAKVSGDSGSGSPASAATPTPPPTAPAKAPAKAAATGTTVTTTPATGNKLADQVRKEAEIAAAEPPAIRVMGSVILRTVPGDLAAVPLEAVTYARQSAERLGFRLDEVEILSFPTQALFVRYLRLAEVPRGEFDTVTEAIDNKVLTSLQVTGGGGVAKAGRILSLAPLIGHVYGHALISSFAEGGTLIPGWVREGIAAMVEPQPKDPMLVLRQAQQQRLLFRSEDLNSQLDVLAADESRRLVFQAQSHSLVQHLLRVGQNQPGLLYTLVQELGAGKSIDEALQAQPSINGTFDDLYNDWARKVMGVR